MLYLQFGEVLLTKLVDQKPQLVQKITNECKLEAANKKQAESTEKAGGATSSSLGAAESKKTQEDDASRALSKLSDNFASMP